MPERTALPPGTVLIAADDNSGPRLSVKGLARKLKIDNESCFIFGKTYAEVKALPDFIIAAGLEYGDGNIVCILDQNMDRYPEGAFLGTRIVSELRDKGFAGLVFIRSANDSAADVTTYMASGANGNLLKGASVEDLRQELLMKFYCLDSVQQ